MSTIPEIMTRERCGYREARRIQEGLSTLPTSEPRGASQLFFMLTESIDKEIRTLESDLAAVERGEGPEQPRIAAESTRLRQAITALHRIRTEALVASITEAQAHAHEKPLQLD